MVEINERLKGCIVEAAQTLAYALCEEVEMRSCGDLVRLGNFISGGGIAEKEISTHMGVQISILAAALYTEKCRIVGEIDALKAELEILKGD